MSDSYGEPQQQGAQGNGSRGQTGRGGARGGRGGGNREGGGFRIRLSENEMRSARALQEAFNLRSTVAVLGFALRTLGQMLADLERIEEERDRARADLEERHEERVDEIEREWREHPEGVAEQIEGVFGFEYVE